MVPFFGESEERFLVKKNHQLKDKTIVSLHHTKTGGLQRMQNALT